MTDSGTLISKILTFKLLTNQGKQNEHYPKRGHPSLEGWIYVLILLLNVCLQPCGSLKCFLSKELLLSRASSTSARQRTQACTFQHLLRPTALSRMPPDEAGLQGRSGSVSEASEKGRLQVAWPRDKAFPSSDCFILAHVSICFRTSRWHYKLKLPASTSPALSSANRIRMGDLTFSSSRIKERRRSS